MDYIIKTSEELEKDGWVLHPETETLRLSVPEWHNFDIVLDYMAIPLKDIVAVQDQIGQLSSFKTDCGKKIVRFHDRSVWEVACNQYKDVLKNN